MSAVNLSSALPKGEANGLGPMVKDAISEPDGVHTLILLVNTKKIVTDCDDGSSMPVLRILRAEVVRGGDLKDTKRLIRRAVERRTGQAQLDLEVEDELEQMFKAIDLQAEEEDQTSGDTDKSDDTDE